MARYARIFCENCGAELNADVSQQYVKCDSCGVVINNPKYVGQSDTFVQTTGECDFGKLFSKEKKKGFNKLKGFFGFGGDHDDDDEDYDEDEDVEIDTHDDLIEEFDEEDDDFDRNPRRRNPFNDDNGFGRSQENDYYAVIEKSALFYKGECPGISFTSSGLCRSYDECIDSIEEKLGRQVGAFGKKQPDPRTLHLDRDQKIVRVRPRR